MKIFKLFTCLLSAVLLASCFSACKPTIDPYDLVVPDTALVLELKHQDDLTINVKTRGVSATISVDGSLIMGSYDVADYKITIPASKLSAYNGNIVNAKLTFFDKNEELVDSQNLTIDIVDRAISTADEFDAWYTDYMTYGEKPTENANLKSVISEHIILTADLDLAKSYNNWGMAGWLTHLFTGTFDGRGHIIYGFSSANGFIPNLGKTGVIKNLALVDMTTTGRNGFVGMFLCGTIENCYFQGEHTTTNPQYYSGFYFRYYNDQANPKYYAQKVSNVVIDVQRADFAISYDAFFDSARDLKEYKGGKFVFGKPDVSVFDNVYMINNAYNGKVFNENGGFSDITMFDSVWDFAIEITELPDGFSDEYWEISDDGLRFKGIK